MIPLRRIDVDTEPLALLVEDENDLTLDKVVLLVDGCAAALVVGSDGITVNVYRQSRETPDSQYAWGAWTEPRDWRGEEFGRIEALLKLKEFPALDRRTGGEWDNLKLTEAQLFAMGFQTFD